MVSIIIIEEGLLVIKRLVFDRLCFWLDCHLRLWLLLSWLIVLVLLEVRIGYVHVYEFK